MDISNYFGLIAIGVVVVIIIIAAVWDNYRDKKNN